MALVDMHSSWLVINSIVGCTNACKYCFLQDKNNHLNKPRILDTPQEAIKELLEYKFYDVSIPLCLFPNTDIFLNEENITYLIETLQEIRKNNIRNTLVLITKCLIPEEVLKILSELNENYTRVVVYLSYSGLDNTIEPNVKHKDILLNFKNLKKYNIPVVHYYRPFIEQNSKKEKIKETLELVHQYTPVSATMGLMYVPTMTERQEFCGYLKEEDKQKLKNATSIFPEEAWNYLYKEYDSEQFFYQTNTCALNTILNRPSMQYYNTKECKNFNYCDPIQRKLCSHCSQKKDKKEIITRLDLLLKKIGIIESYEYQFDNEHGLELKNISLDVKSLSYLSYMLGIKVYVVNGRKLNDIYNSSLNGATPMIVRSKRK